MASEFIAESACSSPELVREDERTLCRECGNGSVTLCLFTDSMPVPSHPDENIEPFVHPPPPMNSVAPAVFRRCLLSGVVVVATSLFHSRAQGAGALDPSFGSSGFVLTDFGLGADRAAATVVQPDGKVLVAGNAFTSVALARYGTTGGVEMRTLYSPTTAADFFTVTSLALQSDGKILVAGGTFSPTGDFFVIRFHPNGTVDTAFGDAGIARIAFDYPSTNPSALARKVLVLSSGKIWLLGEFDIPLDESTPRAALAFLNADGSRDVSLGDGGLLLLGATTPTNPNDAPYSAIFDAVEQGGKVVVAGGIGVSDPTFFSHLLLARLDPVDASLDTTFGTAGRTLVPVVRDNTLTSIVLLPDSRILGLDTSRATAVGVSAPVRVRGFTVNGFLDPSLDGNAPAVASLPRLAVVNTTAWIAGSSGSWPSRNLSLTRLEGWTRIDPLFGSAGSLAIETGADEVGAALAIQSDGRVVVAGTRVLSSTAADFLVARVQPNALSSPLTPPLPPSQLTALAVTSTSITLRWVDQANNESEYIVERSVSSNFANPVRVAITGANITTFLDNGLLPRTTYFYRVWATNAAGSSPAITATAKTPRR